MLRTPAVSSADVSQPAKAVANDCLVIFVVTVALGWRRLVRDQRFSLHRGWDLVSCQIQQCRRDVKKTGPGDLALQRAVGRGQDERPELGVVAVVGPGVILQDVDRRIADAADRSPVEGAEVDDQVGRDVLDRVVDLLGLEDQCSQRLAIGAVGRLELRLDLSRNDS